MLILRYSKINKNLKVILTAIIIFFIMLSIYIINTKLEKKIEINLNHEEMQELAPRESDTYKVFDKDAKYTMISYFSIDCSECRKVFLAEDEILNNLKGKVNILYRNNPLASQPLSAGKAVIAECVKDLSNKEIYFNYLRDIFTNFSILNLDNNWAERIASKYVDEKSLVTCLDNKKYQNKIDNQKIENNIFGIIYTPSVILFKNAKQDSEEYNKRDAKKNSEYVSFYQPISSTGFLKLLNSLTN